MKRPNRPSPGFSRPEKYPRVSNWKTYSDNLENIFGKLWEERKRQKEAEHDEWRRKLEEETRRLDDKLKKKNEADN